MQLPSVETCDNSKPDNPVILNNATKTDTSDQY